ncbi:MAG: CBS domain-containing protein [Chloroflexota bacterium]|nr:CBS domain-containing protein [Chloroflexota bacterium]
MRTPESITQRTTIREADALLEIESITVRAGDDLQRVAEAAGAQPGARVIAVVDHEGRLAGILPVQVLVDNIYLKIVPEEFLAEITGIEQTLAYARNMGARTAGDLMLDPVSVGMNDTVRDAFALLHRPEVSGLPITDDERRVVGYIDQLELLLVWVRACGLEPLLGGQPEGDA